MEKIDILIWAIGGGFAVLFAGVVLSFKILREDIGNLDKRMDKFDEKLTDIDRRLCRFEGAFASKDCCMIKDHRINEIAE